MGMNKTIYHGSSSIVRNPKFGAGRAFNDFGLGFYCSESLSHASEWAVRNGSNGFVTAYALDCSGLRIIDLCSPQYSLMHWLYLLLVFREFDPSTHLHVAKEYISKEFAVDYQACDCIAGYRADNCSYALAADFLNNRLSYETLHSIIRKEDIGRQFVLKSNRAFDRILYTGYETAHSMKHYPAKVSRELRYIKSAQTADAGGLYISQMIEEGIKSYDTRLR